jgi:hypothetical protein
MEAFMDANGVPATNGLGQPAVPPIDANFRIGLAMLWQAFKYAENSVTDQWDFALEIDKLYETRLSISDLRWLVAKGYALHGRETSVPGDLHRSFQPSLGLTFANNTCFVLTPKGATFVSNALKQSSDTV